jgi:hypothetical protein
VAENAAIFFGEAGTAGIFPQYLKYDSGLIPGVFTYSSTSQFLADSMLSKYWSG